MRRQLLGAGFSALVLAACMGSTPTTTPAAPPGSATPAATGLEPSTPAATGPRSSTSAAKRYRPVDSPIVGPDGTLYASDCVNGIVFAYDSPTSGHIVAGDGTGGEPPFGDGGPATQAQLVCPAGLTFDREGRLLIADHGHNRIRRIDADGIIETIVGAASPPVVNGGAFTGDGGPAHDASLNAPVGLTVDAAGNLFIGDRENDRVRKVSPDGIITTLAGDGTGDYDGDGIPATEASLDFPLNTAVDAAGNVYISDDNHNRIRKVDTAGMITTVLGDGSFSSGGDGGPAAKAATNDPNGLAMDAAGNLYVAEYGGNRIRRIDPTGIVTTIAGTGEPGTDGVGGPALSAQMAELGGLSLGPDGALYVVDQATARILRIDLATGILTLAAGGSDGVTTTP